MNLERVPLAPLTPIQIQQLARQPRYTKNQNIQLQLQNQNFNQVERTCLMRNPKYRNHKKVVLELLNSIQSFSYPEFLFGVHIDMKDKQQIHICPTTLLIKSLNKHFGISEILDLYEKIYSQNKDSQIQFYVNYDEIDIIIQLLNSIINQKLDIFRIKEIIKEQSVQDLINLKKFDIKDQKLQQIVNMINFLNNQTLFKLSKQVNQKILRTKQIICLKDHCQRYIYKNIKQLGIYIFLEFCIKKSIVIPELLISIKICQKQQKIYLESDFSNYILDSMEFIILKKRIKYQNFNRILSLEQLIEFEQYLVQEFSIVYPFKDQNDQLIIILQNLVQNLKITQNYINSMKNGQKLLQNLVDIYKLLEIQNNLDQQQQKIMLLLQQLTNDELNQDKNVPKIKLKIRKL